MKTNQVFSQPYSTNENVTNIGETKYPNEPTDVTIDVASVLVERGKCFATIDTGMLIAVAPKPTPINMPIAMVK